MKYNSGNGLSLDPASLEAEKRGLYLRCVKGLSEHML